MPTRIAVTLNLDEAARTAVATIADDRAAAHAPVWVERTPGPPADAWEVHGADPMLPSRHANWPDAKHAFALAVADRLVQAVTEER